MARTREDRLRLVTTNFDRLFDIVSQGKQKGDPFRAPLLPIPKTRLNGIVYLHGFLPEHPHPDDLDKLVLSSGDFGLAYLTEAWAARFVSELFRNFTVCFVGYSIADPVLRYMTDALAADRLLGQSHRDMFAFGSASEGEQEWEAKNVTPVLYQEDGGHAYFHNTIRAWSETYRDGLLGKERIVVSFAGADPRTSTQQEDFVGRVLWALDDPSGSPAKRFAQLDPVPRLEWLEALEPLLRRSRQHSHVPQVVLVDSNTYGHLDRIARYLGLWLARHLNDPQLVLWIARQGARLNDQFRDEIEHQIDRLDSLQREGNQEELDRVRESSPNAIPSPRMRVLWELILAGRLKSTSPTELSLTKWLKRVRMIGLTPSLRIQLRDFLSPHVSLRATSPLFAQGVQVHEDQSTDDSVDWEIVLSADHVHSALTELDGSREWKSVLPDLLPDFSQLLRDAAGLMSELSGLEDGGASILHQPSISDHPQNRNFHDWTALIVLNRDAWLATARSDSERARLAAESWWEQPYSVFKRLALFAAAHGSVISADEAFEWLLDEDGRWVWSVETQREMSRLLVALAPRLNGEAMAELESVILEGPPREMFRDDLEDEQWQLLVEREVWLRLSKLEAARC